MEKYKIVNGTAYNAATPDAVVRVLETARRNGDRIRIFYGDTETGRSWLDEWGTMGTVGRSIGPHKIPLLIQRRGSLGGAGILDHCIIRITETRGGGVLYTHPNFHCPQMLVAPWGSGYGVFRLDDKSLLGKFPTEAQAHRWVDFIEGRRNTK